MKALKIGGAIVLAAGAVIALVVGGRWLLTPPPAVPDVTQGEVAATQVDVAAKIAARVASELFTELDAPVGRLAALDTWVGYNPGLEAETLPQVADIVREAERLLRY